MNCERIREQIPECLAGRLAAAWGAIKEPARIAIRFVVDTFLGMVDNILTGAAKAFGWVPGLGDNLKKAAGEFREFRDNVNRSLGGIDDEAVKVALSYSSRDIRLTAGGGGHAASGRATGGAIHGPGTGTSDTAGLFRLSNGEHVWTAREVRAAGGHGVMEAMRRSVRGLAKGGAVDFDVRTGIPAEGPINAIAKNVARTFGQAIGKTIGGTGGPPGAVQSFRGERLNARTIRMLLSAERILGHVFRIMQGSYSTRVAASGGTHSGGGAMDTDGPGGWNTAVSALRRSGFAAWHRTPSQGPWGHHIHSIAIGDPTASPSAKRQVQSFLRGGSGLGFDDGGYLPTGVSIVRNNTGKPEPLTRADQATDLTPATITALRKAFTQALNDARPRLVPAASGAYTLQFSNG